jgi:tetratricopeptide (TPR) repeat protein
MDPSEIDSLVQRLVANPHDEGALAYAHRQGSSDPKSYALLLERVGSETQDAAYAAHWLSEAANIWSTTLGDAHRAARVLMQAIDRDPTARIASDRLAQLYRDKGDTKALVALLERRAKALAPMAAQSDEIKLELASMHEELGRLWAETLAQPKKGLENFRRSIDLDASNPYPIYAAREIYKSQGQFDEAFSMYEAELSIEQDAARKIALLRDEAATHRTAGDLAGATRALGRARQLDEGDPTLQQEFASSIVDRIQAGENVAPEERQAGAAALVGLAEAYDGEHGLAYAAATLDIEPGHDRGLQLYAYYARALQREEDLSSRYLAYVTANPSGEMSGEARHLLAASYEAAGQIQNAIQMLEPLRAVGDPDAIAKLQGLYAQAGMQPPPLEAPRVPSVPPPPGVGGSAPPPAFGQPKVPSYGPPAGPDSRRAGPMTPDKLQGVLDAAQMLANKGKKPEAFAKYKEVLEGDPAHPEALSWVEDYLRSKRDYGQLREVLLAAVRTMPTTAETIEARKERLREVAGLCEGNLRDVDGAINAWKQLLAVDRSDDGARQALTRTLEKTQRWDDLANLLEQEATAESDLEKKIVLEKKLANLQETKRRDFSAAAESWQRIANITPEDDRAIATASRMFEKAGQVERAAEVIADNAEQVTDPVARGSLLERLAELREQFNDAAGAGEAYANAAEAQGSLKLWEASERCFVTAERWANAASAADHRAQMTAEAKEQAQLFARAAEHLARAGDDEGVLSRLEQAADLDPTAEEYSALLVDRYTAASKWDKLVQLLSKRGDRLADRMKRVATRRQAAMLYATQLADAESAREMWLKILEDGDDREALEKLIDAAVERADHTEATTLLRRLMNATTDRSEKARVALREAELLAEGVGDVDTAIARYESILADLDATCRPALQAIADLQEARENPAAAADALERELKLVADAQERGQIAARLARLYEQLGDAKSAIRALDIVRKADLEDFDALARLCDLCEKTEQWDRVAELLAQRIEVEADEAEASPMTRKLATILADKLDRGDEALAAMTELADQGDAQIRAVYVELGDRLGWKGIVATKLVEWWFEAKHGVERTSNLRGAFERFAEVGRDQDAVRVAVEVARSRGTDRSFAEQLEQLAIKTNDFDALSLAHDLLARDLTGPDRARELVRQAEGRVRAGGSRLEALQHGEVGLTSVPATDAEPLLERLAALAEKPNDVIDLYERQISRSKSPADRTRALARAAQVAAQRGQLDRARNFFELALAGTPTEETLSLLETSAREGDVATGGEKLRRVLATAMSSGGQGARDGGRTRGALLRRAASMAQHDLRDVEQAFAWLGDALIAHVDATTLDALEVLGGEVHDARRAESTLTRVLSEVFDGPLVRQLLGRRAKIRREQLNDRPGAAADLKKLHDLSPNDQAVMEDLSGLLTELGDYRGMVQLYEDQILRGKDMHARAELARKVARMWEEQLQDPREAADAWRRVLRMKQGDPEATAGLERAKSNMLKKPDPTGFREAYAPPKLQSSPSYHPPPPASQPPITDPAGGAHVANSEPRTSRTGDLGAQQPDVTVPKPLDPEPSSQHPRPEHPLFHTSRDDVTASVPLHAAETSIPDDDPYAKTGEVRTVEFLDTGEATQPPTGTENLTEAMGEHPFPGGDDVIIADDLAEMIEADEPPPATLHEEHDQTTVVDDAKPEQGAAPKTRTPMPPIPRS